MNHVGSLTNQEQINAISAKVSHEPCWIANMRGGVEGRVLAVVSHEPCWIANDVNHSSYILLILFHMKLVGSLTDQPSATGGLSVWFHMNHVGPQAHLTQNGKIHQFQLPSTSSSAKTPGG